MFFWEEKVLATIKNIVQFLCRYKIRCLSFFEKKNKKKKTNKQANNNKTKQNINQKTEIFLTI